jgi:hypothetical protein
MKTTYLLNWTELQRTKIEVERSFAGKKVRVCDTLFDEYQVCGGELFVFWWDVRSN